jgi:hypothetical protein
MQLWLDVQLKAWLSATSKVKPNQHGCVTVVCHGCNAECTKQCTVKARWHQSFLHHPPGAGSCLGTISASNVPLCMVYSKMKM